MSSRTLTCTWALHLGATFPKKYVKIAIGGPVGSAGATSRQPKFGIFQGEVKAHILHEKHIFRIWWRPETVGVFPGHRTARRATAIAREIASSSFTSRFFWLVGELVSCTFWSPFLGVFFGPILGYSTFTSPPSREPLREHLRRGRGGKG